MCAPQQLLASAATPTCATVTLIGLQPENADELEKDFKPLPSDRDHVPTNLKYSRSTLSSKEQGRAEESNCFLDHEASSLLQLFNQDVVQLNTKPVLSKSQHMWQSGDVRTSHSSTELSSH